MAIWSCWHHFYMYVTFIKQKLEHGDVFRTRILENAAGKFGFGFYWSERYWYEFGGNNDTPTNGSISQVSTLWETRILLSILWCHNVCWLWTIACIRYGELFTAAWYLIPAFDQLRCELGHIILSTLKNFEHWNHTLLITKSHDQAKVVQYSPAMVGFVRQNTRLFNHRNHVKMGIHFNF